MNMEFYKKQKIASFTRPTLAQFKSLNIGEFDVVQELRATDF